MGNIYENSVEEIYQHPLIRILHDTPRPAPTQCNACESLSECPYCLPGAETGRCRGDLSPA